MEFEVGRFTLNSEGIEYYGKNGIKVLFSWPIQLGTYTVMGIGENPVRLEIVREGKKYFFIAYDDRKLGMVAKGELLRVHIRYMIIERICRKLKVSSALSKIETIEKNGVITKHRVWLKNPDTVEEDKLRTLLCRK